MRLPDRTYMFRKLFSDEREMFRAAGRDNTIPMLEDIRGPNVEICPWHHPEYRLGQLEVLLDAARHEATLAAERGSRS